MKEGKERSLFDLIIDYAPIAALLLVWITIGMKTPKTGNPYFWVVGLTSLPGFLTILYSGYLVHRKRSKMIKVKRGTN